jgi:hypothetical protein
MSTYASPDPHPQQPNDTQPSISQTHAVSLSLRTHTLEYLSALINILIYPSRNTTFFEDHFILGKRASLITEDEFNLPKLFYQITITALCVLDILIIHANIVIDQNTLN